jgi:hypothetical protein
MQENKSQIIIYQTESGETKLDVRFQDETVWLTQKLMSELFQTSIPNINMHLKNIFEEGELEENRTIKDFLIVQKEGNREVKRKQVFYNLDAIISVGYRIKSNIATKFRQWISIGFFKTEIKIDLKKNQKVSDILHTTLTNKPLTAVCQMR